MGLLKRSTTAGACLSLLAASACLLAGGEREEPFSLSFPHAIHAEQGLDCSMCHAGVESEEAAGLPAEQVCMLCHSDEEQPPGPEAVHALFGAEGFRATGAARLAAADVSFSHARHVGAELECADCHGDVTQAPSRAQLAVTMDECMACHTARGRANDCQVCHQEIRADRPPATHLLAWTRRHGGVALSGDERTVNRCDLCHTETTCLACHQERPPADHTNYWRHRGHGRMASLDRSRCSTCHRSDFCERCHAETAPRSHVGSWGSPRNRHCLSCHLPLSGETCITCHKSDSSHALAPPRPSDATHATAGDSDCRTCHGPNLRHVDNGDSCLQCH